MVGDGDDDVFVNLIPLRLLLAITLLLMVGEQSYTVITPR